jgi:hypothetical protein
MNSTPLDSSFQCASFETRKNFTSFFSFKRNSQKNKKLIFLLIFGSHTNKWGLSPSPKRKSAPWQETLLTLIANQQEQIALLRKSNTAGPTPNMSADGTLTAQANATRHQLHLPHGHHFAYRTSIPTKVILPSKSG